MSKETKQELLTAKRTQSLAGGGEQKIEEQHLKGRMTARERIDTLLDVGSFMELDQFVVHRCIDFGMENTVAPAEGVVSGYGTVDGRLVYIYAQDSTVLGGSLGEMHAAKICKVIDQAVKVGAPVIGLLDSGGARLQEGLGALAGYGEIFKRKAQASGVVPLITAVLGDCSGCAVYAPALSDFVLMLDKAQMFINGPQVIKGVTGTTFTGEDLGGALMHNQQSGSAHFYAASEAECFAQLRRLLGFLPANNLEGAPLFDCQDAAERADDLLREIVPDNDDEVYDMRQIVTACADDHDFLEVQPLWANNILTGFIRLHGVSCGIVANQPLSLGGYLDMNAVDKAARFIRFCDSMGLPLVTFTDSPGFLPSAEQEQAGLIRHCAKLVYAYAEATVPKLTVITRRAYGGAYLAMGSKALDVDMVMAWPTAEIALLPAAGAANILYRQEIESADDPQAMRDNKITVYSETYATPYPAAERGLVDLITEPEYTRCYLIKALDPLLTKKEARPGKKHGNSPC